MGGSPCQGFSFAGKNLNFEDPRSKLFFDFVRVLKILKPKYFLLENVRMKKESQDVISEYLGVEPIAINSNLVSAQNRHRLYWTNIPFSIPHDKGIVLADILENGVTDREKSHCLDANYFKGGNLKSYFEKHRRQLVFNNKGGAIRGRYDKDGKIKQQLELRSDDKTNSLTTVQKDNVVVRVPELKSAFGACIQVGEADLKGHDIIKRVYSPKGKAPTLTTMGGGHREPKVIVDELTWRKLTPLECERLQTVPDGYTEGVSNTQRYKMLGNGWTVDVVAHILKGIRHKEEGLETINKWTKYGLAL
jgi:DNA-cytosine methyltransferase